MPSEAEKQAFIEWVRSREQAAGDQPHRFMTVNGAAVMPEVLMLPASI